MKTNNVLGRRSGGWILALAVAVIGLAAGSMQGASYYWDTTTTGPWATGANWSTDPSGSPAGSTAPANSATTDTAVFNGSGVNGAETVQLSATRSIAGITFNNTGTTLIQSDTLNTSRNLTIGTGGVIVNAGAGAVTIGNGSVQASAYPVSIVISSAQTWTNNSSSTLTIGGSRGYNGNGFTGANYLTVAGSGNFQFCSQYFGPGAGNAVTINTTGIVTMDFVGNYTGNLILNNGVTTATAGTVLAYVTANTIFFNGGQLKESANTIYYGQYQAAANCSQFSSAAGNLINLDLNGQTFTIGQNLTSSGGSLTITNSGAASTLTLSGTNTYTGVTVINKGTLKVSIVSSAGVYGALGLNSAVTLANVSGATLDLNGNATQIGSLTGGGVTGGNVTLGAGVLIIGGDNTSPAAYAGVISSSTAGNGLTKIGNGMLTLSGANTFTGTTTINGGTVSIATDGTSGGQPLGAYPGSVTPAAVTLNNGTVLATANTTLAVNRGITLGASGGTVDASSGQALTINSVIAGSGNPLAKGSNTGTVTLGAANTYSGNTTISAGTLKLSLSATIANTPRISISPGATFDVSSKSTPYSFGSTTLSASGTGTTPGTDAAAIIGPSGGTVSLGSNAITLTYDGSHPALYISQGTLSLGGNSFTVNAGSPLANGPYTLIQQASGSITDGGSYPSVTGTAISSGSSGHISVSGGNVILTVTSAENTTTTLARTAGSSSQTYGSSLTFVARVTGASTTPIGNVVFKDGGTTLATVALVAGTSPEATATFSPTTEIGVSGSPHSITAYYQGDTMSPPHSISDSSLSPITQTLAAKALIVSPVSANSKMYDGTTSATISGTLVGVVSGDMVTFNGIGTFSPDATVGNNKTVNSSSTITQSGANYTLTQPTGLTADILDTATWTNTVSGLWDTAGNWLQGVVGAGTNNTANFNTVDITADTTININSARTIGSLVFGDTDPTGSAANWTLTNSALTLAGTTPTITVNALGTGKSVTIGSVVTGSSGLTKAGVGTLFLSTNNTYTGGTTVSNGVLALGSATAINTSGTISFGGGTLKLFNTTDYSSRFNTADGQAVSLDLNGQNVPLATALTSVGGALTVTNSTGTGYLNLGNTNNTIFAGLTINGGTVRLNDYDDNAPNALGAGVVTVNTGGTLQLGGAAGAYYPANTPQSFALNGGAISLTGNHVGNYNLATGLGATLNVGVFGGTLLNYVWSSSLTVSGQLTGSGALSLQETVGQSRTGVFVISNPTNTYNGTISLSAAATVTVQLNLADPTALQYATLNLASSGGNNYAYLYTNATIAGLTGSSGIVRSQNAAGTFTLNVSNNVANNFSGILQNYGSGILALQKSGAGTLTLSGVNTYSGGTTINGGVLNAGIAQTASTSGPLGASGNIMFGGGTLQFSAASAGWDPSARIASGTSARAVSLDTAGQSITFASQLTSNQSGGLTKLGAGTLTLSYNGMEAYGGSTTINEGTLALSGASSALPAASAVTIAAGGTLDVTGRGASATYTLGSSAMLTASGTGTVAGSSAAEIMGGANGIVSLGAQPITLAFDGIHPALYVSQGTLSLGANRFTVNSSSPLASGTYTIIQQATGSITDGGSYPAVTGTAIGPGTSGSISVSGGAVILTVFPSEATMTTLARTAGSGSETYGSTLTFVATVTGDSVTPGGNVIFKDGATPLATVAVVAGVSPMATASYTSTSLGVSGSPHSIVAYYQGDNQSPPHAAGDSSTTTGPISQSITAKVLTVTPNAVSTAYAATTLNNTTYSDTTANYAISGFVNGETISSLGLTLSGSMTFNGLTATVVRNAGTYTLAQGTLAMAASNYSMSFVNAAPNNYVITPRALTLTAVANNKIFDSSTSAAAVPTVSGLQSGDTVSPLAETYDTATEGQNKTLTVTTYTVNDGNSGNNYSVSLVANTSGAIYPVGSSFWSVNNSGNWGDGGNWTGGVPDGSGKAADFNTVNITADRTVTLDSPRTIGTLTFGDTTPSHGWILSGGNTLTLAVDSGTPTLTVNAGSVTISTVLDGAQGVKKEGAGTLILSGANTMTGAVTLNAGTLEPNGTTSLGTNGTFTINGGTLRGQVYTSMFSVSAAVNSIWAGDFTFNANNGGGTFAGTVTLSNGTRTVTWNNGSSSSLSVGAIGDGGNGYGLTMIGNSGSHQPQTLTITGASTYGGDTTLSGGSASQPITIAAGVTNALPYGVGKGNLCLNNNGAFSVNGKTVNINGLNGTAFGAVNGGGTLILGNGDSGGSFTGIVSSALALIKTGNGTQSLLGTNTYSGVTTVSNGYIAVGNSLALSTNLVTFAGGNLSVASGSLALTNKINLANSATVDTAGHSLTLQGTITNAGSLTKAGTGTLMLSATNTYSGATTIGSGTLEIGGAGQLRSGNYAGAITNNATLVWASLANQTLSGDMAGTGSLIKTNSGTLTLTGAKTYSGDTTVLQGTLDAVSLGASSVLSVSNSATLIIRSDSTIANTADVRLDLGAQMDLNYSGTNTVNSLTIGGVPQCRGVWGASGSGARFTCSQFVTGHNGILRVVNGPDIGTVYKIR